MVILKIRRKAFQKLMTIKNKMIFNGLIRTIQISYMKNCLVFGYAFRSLIIGEDIQTLRVAIGGVTCFV